MRHVSEVFCGFWPTPADTVHKHCSPGDWQEEKKAVVMTMPARGGFCYSRSVSIKTRYATKMSEQYRVGRNLMMHVAGDANVSYLAVDFEPFRSTRNSPLAAFHPNQE
jgi:hypothetical protein